MKVLLTGGTGYIGSHTAVELLNVGHEIVIIDNLVNSKKEVVDKIKEITNKDVTFYEGDVRNAELLDEIFNKESIDAVIHFAGLKAVGESVEKPLEYYDVNINTTLVLLNVMKKHNVKKIVFSSSACVYKPSDIQPIKEDFPVETYNPYGTTKYINEMILKDLYNSDNKWRISLLRYFNPVGAHESGLIGEDPNGIPNNLMPYVLKVAGKEYEKVTVFGNDYDTPDGTGVRDYIHVVDLAIGHVKAIDYMENNEGLEIVNLGTGEGYSVIDLLETFKKANNIDLPYVIGTRREGDIGEYYGDPAKAKELYGFVTSKTLSDMCRDSYNFYCKKKEKKNFMIEYEKDIEEIIEILEEKGIVTRNDFTSIDSRPYSKKIDEVLRKKNLDNFEMVYANLENHYDYTQAFYNNKIFTREQAVKYLEENVLFID